MSEALHVLALRIAGQIHALALAECQDGGHHDTTWRDYVSAYSTARFYDERFPLLADLAVQNLRDWYAQNRIKDVFGADALVIIQVVKRHLATKTIFALASYAVSTHEATNEKRTSYCDAVYSCRQFKFLSIVCS